MRQISASSGSALVLALMLLAAPLRAQIVNVLSPSMGLDPDGVKLGLGQTFDASGGNVEKFRLTSSLAFRYQREAHTFFVTGSAAYGKVSGEVNTQKLFAHARYRFTFAAPWTLFAFVQGNHDKFRRLEGRAIGGGGVETRFSVDDRAEWNLGLALMPEYEVLTDEVIDEQGFALRLSGFVSQSYRLMDWLTLSGTTFFQPRVDQPSDFRLLNDFSLRFQVTRYLTLQSTIKIIYDSAPPLGVEPLDWTLKHGIVLRYQEIFGEQDTP